MIDKVATASGILLRAHPTHYIEHVAELLIALLAPEKSNNFTQFLSALAFFLNSINE
jgi:hypothetical protein